MMVQKSCLLILSLLLLSSCSYFREPEKEIVTVTEIVKPTIAIIDKPKSLKLDDINWYVVTKDNIEEFKSKFADKEGDLVFYAMSVRSYENLALNMAQIKEYIMKQNEIIIYYEEAVTWKEDIIDEEILQ